MGFSTQTALLSSTFSTSSTSFTDVTGQSITVANQTGGKFILNASHNGYNSGSSGVGNYLEINDTSTSILETLFQNKGTNDYYPLMLADVGDTDGSVRKLRTRVSAGTINLRASNGGRLSVMEMW